MEKPKTYCDFVKNLEESDLHRIYHYLNYSFVIMLSCLFFTSACKKDEKNEELTLTTSIISNITQTTAVCGGEITNEGGLAVTAKGVCWSIHNYPTISDNITIDGTGLGVFSSNLRGLNSYTPYNVRAYAINSSDTAYGNSISFITIQIQGEKASDIEGNIYNTVTIGKQTWMVENLKTTKFNDSTDIPLVLTLIDDARLLLPAFTRYYIDSATYSEPLGLLYNWYAVNTNKLCPVGWHVPVNNEWTDLIAFLGGKNVAGGRLKEEGISHWKSPNEGATNESGFTALPAGIRPFNLDTYYKIGTSSYFWTATESNYYNAYAQVLNYLQESVYEYSSGSKELGFSVRCIKD